MSEEEKLQLENECLLKHSKAQMIQKYIDELEENCTLSDLWCKSQEENKQLHSIIREVREYINSIDEIEVRYLDKEALYRNHITEYQIQEQLKKDKTLEGHFVKVNKYYLLEILDKENNNESRRIC